jgi:hypothetical protein
MEFRLSRVLLFVIPAIAALPVACSTTVRESFDSDLNYRWKFEAMPEPRPEIVHSRVEREDPVVFLGFPLSSRNREWEFELIAAPSWGEVLQRGFAPTDWAQIVYRPGIPDWFSPDPEHFSAWYLQGSSGVHSAHLFIERFSRDPSRVRVFVRRH